VEHYSALHPSQPFGLSGTALLQPYDDFQNVILKRFRCAAVSNSIHNVLQARKVVQSRKQQAELDSVSDRLKALELAFLGNKSETMSTAHPSVSVLGSLRQRIHELERERDFAAAAAQLVLGPAGAAALNVNPDGVTHETTLVLTGTARYL
jgi:hypothetical protein